MASLPRVTARQALRGLQRAGWYRHHQRGSHLVLRHPEKHGRVVVPVHAREILYPKTLLSILEQAGMTVEEFRKLI